jgi:hypothetical protein
MTNSHTTTTTTTWGCKHVTTNPNSVGRDLAHKSGKRCPDCIAAGPADADGTPRGASRPVRRWVSGYGRCDCNSVRFGGPCMCC